MKKPKRKPLRKRKPKRPKIEDMNIFKIKKISGTKKQEDELMIGLMIFLFLLLGCFMILAIANYDKLEQTKGYLELRINASLATANTQDKLFFCSLNSEQEFCVCSERSSKRCEKAFELAYEESI